MAAGQTKSAQEKTSSCYTMNKIVCVGCSWTDQLDKNRHKSTYPYIIKQRHPDWTVYNLGVKGANNFFINMMLETAIRELLPDFVIRQVTGWNRWMWFDDNYKCELNFTEVEEGYFQSDHDKYVEDLVLWTASGLSHPFDNQLTRQELLRRDRLRLEHYSTMPPNFALELEDSALYKTRALLEDIPHLILFWRDNTHKLSGYDLWKTYPCIERDIGFDLVIDAGDHFDSRGNTLLVEQIIDYGRNL